VRTRSFVLLAATLAWPAACAPADLPPPELPVSARPEPQRPQFHFTPATGWMNDPNGLVWSRGEWHLFFQHNPYAPFWADIHWGHAVGTDLVHWTELPPALAPDPVLGMPFSGSAIVATGAAAASCGPLEPGADCLAALFTSHGGADASEKQSLATSADRGRTWTPYPGNPVMPSTGLANWRDPKVLRHGGRWVMALAAGPAIEFHASDDLVAWTKTGEFAPPEASAKTVWECPDLFPLAVAGGGPERLVLVASGGDTLPGTGVRYWTGGSDGSGFVPDGPARPVDGGEDFYAAQTWSDAPDGRRVLIAWMDAWRYAMASPEGEWRGAMTFPRELGLRDDGNGPRLVQAPVAAIEDLRAGPVARWQDRVVEPGTPLAAGSGRTMDARLVIEAGTWSRAGVSVRVGGGEETAIGFDAVTGTVFVDRSRSGDASFDGGFARRHDAPCAPAGHAWDLRVLVDHSSIEAFACGGAAVVTSRAYPDPSSEGVFVWAEGAPARVLSLEIDALATAWPVD
jgi:fructan beta-fructosidase